MVQWPLVITGGAVAGSYAYRCCMELCPTKYANEFCADELTELASAIVALPLRAVQVGALGLRCELVAVRSVL